GLENGRVRYAKQAVSATLVLLEELAGILLFNSLNINRNGEKAEDASSMLIFLNIKAMCREDIDVFVEFVHMDNMKFMSEDTSTIDQNMQREYQFPSLVEGQGKIANLLQHPFT
ncbi:1190_t:CDS:2, partial [Acaulospora colombiana]